MKQSVRNVIIKNLLSVPGWRTSRKLLVLESDDWGSIRMPSNFVFDSLSKEGVDLISDEGYRYNKNDSLATSDDLGSLFEVLSSVNDCTGRPVVMTPVAITANPDFEKIRQTDYKNYFYEPFTETLKRYHGCENSFTFWKEGIEKRLFVPQFHGREHLNVQVWMKALLSHHELTVKAFNHGCWGITTANDPDIKVEFQAAFDFVDPHDLNYQREVIISGLNLFEKLFGYRASYFVPPNGPFSSKLEQICFNEGICFMSVPKLQIEPLGNLRKTKRIHWLGQSNKIGIKYIVRNCFFEPSQRGRDWADSCLSEISTAFKWQKPAIISSHRVNYIGALDKQNRENGLVQLSLLLRKIVKNWPDVEFITSAELGKIMNNE
jgi:hypothetical protein